MLFLRNMIFLIILYVKVELLHKKINFIRYFITSFWYIFWHEVCHLIEFNVKFWRTSRIIPERRTQNDRTKTSWEIRMILSSHMLIGYIHVPYGNMPTSFSYKRSASARFPLVLFIAKRQQSSVIRKIQHTWNIIWHIRPSDTSFIS